MRKTSSQIQPRLPKTKDSSRCNSVTWQRTGRTNESKDYNLPSFIIQKSPIKYRYIWYIVSYMANTGYTTVDFQKSRRENHLLHMIWTPYEKNGKIFSKGLSTGKTAVFLKQPTFNVPHLCDRAFRLGASEPKPPSTTVELDWISWQLEHRSDTTEAVDRVGWWYYKVYSSKHQKHIKNMGSKPVMSSKSF